MSRGINKVILLGRLGNDPEVKYTANGSAVTNISVATSEQWKDKQTGEMQTKTEWSRVVFFGKLAEIAGQYLKKGSQVYVEGSLRTNKYTDKNGIERYSTDIHATEMQMVGGRESDSFDQRASFAKGNSFDQRNEQAQSFDDDFDSTIPF